MFYYYTFISKSLLPKQTPYFLNPGSFHRSGGALKYKRITSDLRPPSAEPYFELNTRVTDILCHSYFRSL